MRHHRRGQSGVSAAGGSALAAGRGAGSAHAGTVQAAGQYAPEPGGPGGAAGPGAGDVRRALAAGGAAGAAVPGGGGGP